MQFTLGNHTSIGRVRTANEDSFGNWITPNGHLFVVCDGMGGHIGGAIASQAAASAIYQTMSSQKFPSAPIALEYCLETANKKLHDIVAGNASLHGMGTTAVAVLVQDDAAYYAHIGDSRLYLFRQNTLRRLTRDHSFVQSLVDQGHISEEEAEKHARRNEIYRALGIQETVEPTVAPSPVMLQPGDRLLLCTDGLNGMIGDKGISGVMGIRGLSVQQQAEKLVQQADEAGGHDNTTVQIILMRPTPQPSIGETVHAAASAAAIPPAAPIPETPVQTTTTTTTSSSTEDVSRPRPEPQRAHQRKEHFLQPVDEETKPPRKPLLPIIGGITLFLALILLLYNVFREPDMPRLGMEGNDMTDSVTTLSEAPPIEQDSVSTADTSRTATVTTPVAPVPDPVVSETLPAKKATVKKDTTQQAATPSISVPAPTPVPPKKDTAKKALPKAQPKPPKADSTPGRMPKAVMPGVETAP